MQICFLVINYNGLGFLKKYLHALGGACRNAGIHLVIADDNSSDSSIRYLESGNYDYTVNKGRNKGFAANINNGIRYARAIADFDYFIIANNDIEIKQGSLELLKKVISHLDAVNEKIGIIGFDEVFRENAGAVVQFEASKYDLSRSLEKVKSVPGFLFVINDLLINEIGMMDEEYYMYGEDCDYFTRTNQAEYSLYNTHIPVLHYSEGSSKSDKLTSWYVYRNMLLHAQKNLNVFGICRTLLALVWIIYNPVYKYSRHPSNMRIKRNGFLYNNYLLVKSIIWNIKYRLKRQAENEKKFD